MFGRVKLEALFSHETKAKLFNPMKDACMHVITAAWQHPLMNLIYTVKPSIKESFKTLNQEMLQLSLTSNKNQFRFRQPDRKKIVVLLLWVFTVTMQTL
jgi:hypothetical protein